MSRIREARKLVIATLATQVTDLDNSGRANPEKYHKLSAPCQIGVDVDFGKSKSRDYFMTHSHSMSVTVMQDLNFFKLTVSRFPTSSGNHVCFRTTLS